MRPRGCGSSRRLRRSPSRRRSARPCANRSWHRSPCAASHPRSPRGCFRWPRPRHSPKTLTCQSMTLMPVFGLLTNVAFIALRARLLRRGLAEEIVLFHGGKPGMRVGAADHAELVGIGAEFGLELQSVLQRRAGILELAASPASWRPLASRLPKSQRSKSANSSLGDSSGWVSPSPLVWVAS